MKRFYLTVAIPLACVTLLLGIANLGRWVAFWNPDILLPRIQSDLTLQSRHRAYVAWDAVIDAYPYDPLIFHGLKPETLYISRPKDLPPGTVLANKDIHLTRLGILRMGSDAMVVECHITADNFQLVSAIRWKE